MIEEKHRGHDLMHAEMILILFASIAVAQVLLFIWRIKHKKSYQVSCTCVLCWSHDWSHDGHVMHEC